MLLGAEGCWAGAVVVVGADLCCAGAGAVSVAVGAGRLGGDSGAATVGFGSGAASGPSVDFLSPDVISAILEGRQPKGPSLARIPKLLPLSWTEHRPLLA